MFHLNFDLIGSSAIAAAAQPTEANTKAAYDSMIADIWRIIFEYVDSPTIAKLIRPDFAPSIEQHQIVVIKSNFRGVTRFLHILMDKLPTNVPTHDSFHVERTLGELKAVAARCQIFKQTDPTQIDHNVMLATVYAQSRQLKQDLCSACFWAFWFIRSFDDLLKAVPPSALTLNLARLSQALLEGDTRENDPEFLARLISQNELELVEHWIKDYGSTCQYQYYMNGKEEFKYEYCIQTIHQFLKCNKLENAQTLIKLLFNAPENPQTEKAILPKRVSIAEKHRLTKLSNREELQLTGKLIDGYLENEDIGAWGLLIPKAAPEPTSREIACADRDLATIQSLFRKGEIALGFELARKHLTDLDPTTKALKYPDHCFEFLKLVIHLPREKIYKLGPYEFRREDPLTDLLQFIVTRLPDGQRKKELLQHKRMRQLFTYNYVHQFWSSPEDRKNFEEKERKLFVTFNNILDAAIHELDERPRRLCRLAILCINKGIHHSAFEAASLIEDPHSMFQFVLHIRQNSVMLSPNESRMVQAWTLDLPKELRDRLDPSPTFDAPNDVLKLMLSYVDPETAFFTKGVNPQYAKLIDEMSTQQIPDGQVEEYGSGLLNYVSADRADRAFTLLNQIPNISSTEKLGLQCRMIKILVDKEKPLAWDFLHPILKPASASDPASTQVKQILEPINKPLFRFAARLFRDGDIERCFEIAKQLRSPTLIFGCLDNILRECVRNGLILTTQQKSDYVKLAHGLPSEFKFLLLRLAQDHMQHSLAKVIEQGFNRVAVQQEAAKQFELRLDSKRILKKLFEKEDLNDEDIDNILLWIVEEDIKGLIKIKNSSNPGYKKLERFHEQILNIYQILPFLSVEKAATIAKDVNEWPVGLKCLLWAFASEDRLKEKDQKPYNILISALEQQMKMSKQEVVAKVKRDLEKAVEVTPQNPYVTLQEYMEVFSSDLFIAKWALTRMERNCKKDELILIQASPFDRYPLGWITYFLQSNFIKPWEDRGITICERTKPK